MGNFTVGRANASSETAEYLNNVLNKSGYQSDDFFIYGLAGIADIAYNPMNRQISAMQNLSNSKFVYSNDMTRGNYYFSVLEGGHHDYSYIRRYLYNAMPKLFKKYSNKIEPAIDLNSGYDYLVEELHTKNGNDDIYDVLYRPVEASGERSTIIYSYGFGGIYNSGSQYVQAFAKQGYLVYCFDFIGGSNASKSDGSTLEMSIFTEQSDLECVIEKIRSLNESDDDNIFLLGASQGGAVSAITASECVDDIASMVLLYPAFVLADDARERFQNVDEIPDTYYHMWLTVGRVYFESVMEYDFYEHIGKYNKEVLLIHGSEDSIVPISYSERAKDTYSC